MKRGTRQRLSPNCWSAMSRKSEAAADFGATHPTTSRARITIRGLNNGHTLSNLCHSPGGRGWRAGQGRAGLGRPERRAEPEAHRERGRACLRWAEGARPPGGAAAHRHSHARRRAARGRWSIARSRRRMPSARPPTRSASASRRCRSCASPPRRRAASSRRSTWRCNASSAEWPRPATARMGIALRDQRRSGPKQLGPE